RFASKIPLNPIGCGFEENDKNTAFLTFFMNFINPYVREIPYLCPRIVTMPMVTTHHRRLCLHTIV
ncbi:MAG: hypothetical protein Q4E32_04610, partial [Bacteroidales bacterium]|nr:hypothetical protein [Bacteroidales bacterium]